MQRCGLVGVAIAAEHTSAGTGKIEVVMSRQLQDSNIAFEQAFSDDSPQELWRLAAMRTYKDGEIRHINWFSTEASALAHKDWINNGRGRVVSLVKYRAVE